MTEQRWCTVSHAIFDGTLGNGDLSLAQIDSVWKCLLMPEASASCSRAPVGSVPGDGTKIRGVLLLDYTTTRRQDRDSGVIEEGQIKLEWMS